MISINTQKNRDWFLDLFFLSLIIVTFYLLWLGSYPLFTPDEGRYSEVAREMIATNNYITPRVNGVNFLDKPILHYWLQAISLSLFGINEWAIRLFPALFGLIGCLTTYICARRLLDRRTGILSAIILATTPLYFGGAHYANLDLEVAVLISCCLLCCITAIQADHTTRRYFLIATYLFAALGFLTKGMIAIVFPIIVIGIWILLLNRFAVLKKMNLGLGIILFSAIVLPWYFLVQRENPEFFHYFFVTQQISRFLSSGEFNNNHVPMWFFIPIVLIGLFPWTIFVFQAMTNSICQVFRARKNHPVELFLLIWVFTILIFFSIPKSKIITYILPIFPALAILLGYYLSRIWEQAQQKSVYISVALFVGLSLLLAISISLIPLSQLIDYLPNLFLYITLSSIIFSSAALLSVFFIRERTLVKLFTICTFSSVTVLLMLTFNASYLNTRSTKPLITDLKTIIQPTDEIVAYYRYFYDVPLYLSQPITVVADWNADNIALKDNWVREFSLGQHHQQTESWLINEEQFWERWESDQRIFVFMNENSFKRFKQHAKNYFFIGKANDILLLSNQLTHLTQEFKSENILALLNNKLT